MPDIGKVDHVPILKTFVGAVYAGERLEQVMVAYHAAQIQLFQPFGVEASQQHIIHEEQVDFAFFEVFDLPFAVFFRTGIVQNKSRRDGQCFIDRYVAGSGVGFGGQREVGGGTEEQHDTRRYVVGLKKRV